MKEFDFDKFKDGFKNETVEKITKEKEKYQMEVRDNPQDFDVKPYEKQQYEENLRIDIKKYYKLLEVSAIVLIILFIHEYFQIEQFGFLYFISFVGVLLSMTRLIEKNNNLRYMNLVRIKGNVVSKHKGYKTSSDIYFLGIGEIIETALVVDNKALKKVKKGNEYVFLYNKRYNGSSYNDLIEIREGNEVIYEKYKSE